MNYKELLIILAVLVSAEASWLGWRVYSLRKIEEAAKVERAGKEIEETEEKTTISAETIEKGAKLWLEPSEGEFSGQFTVDILLKTERLIDGTDVYLFYPKDKLSVVDQDTEREGVQIEVGKFDEYPANKVDEEQGLILLSGIVLQGETVVSSEQPFLAGRVVFNIIASGQAELSFDFQPGSTTDSNVADSQTHEDILKEALGAEYSLR